MSIVFYPDSEPGITRRRQGRGFSYLSPDGTRIACARKRAELEAIAVPPAYEDVWLSPLINGHLRATGRDERARKQYIYHPDWAAERQAAMFDSLADFAKTLPRLRGWIARALRGEVGAFDTGVACALAMMDRYSLRVGNPVYTEENGSFGVTTLRVRHFTPKESGLRLVYLAKGGKEVEKQVTGSRLVEVLTQMSQSGHRVAITWRNNGRTVPLQAQHLNDRLTDLCGEKASAKMIRTWNGTHAAFLAGIGAERPTISALSQAAATTLHNTPAIARKSYVHPAIFKTFDRAGVPADVATPPRGLRKGEKDVLDLLEDFGPLTEGDA